MAVPRPWTAEEFAELLAQPSVFVFTAPSGFAVGRVIGDEAELLTIVVDPDARRAGIGRALLIGFQRTARAKGAKSAFLEVDAANKGAIALYERAGWKEVGQRKAYYAGSEGSSGDALVMRKALTKNTPD